MDASFDDLDRDYAASIAERAMRGMAEQGIPPTPTNFAVWFHYFAGRHDDLRNAIDLLIDHDRPFDVRTNRDLFETYVAPKGAPLPSRRPSGCMPSWARRRSFWRPRSPTSSSAATARSILPRAVAAIAW